MFIVLLGPPGAGKGTQARQLAHDLGLPHIATGDLLREAVRDRTALGILAKGYLDRGELAPDDIMGRLIAERLDSPDASQGAVFDGYPRTVKQAIQLDRELHHRGARIGRVICLDVVADTLIERLGDRRVCQRCGTPYNLKTNPPLQPGVCDRCGEPLVRRSDDEPDVIRHRLDVYHQAIGPLEDYYRRQGRLAVVSGDGTVDEVAAAVRDAMPSSPAIRPDPLPTPIHIRR